MPLCFLSVSLFCLQDLCRCASRDPAGVEQREPNRAAELLVAHAWVFASHSESASSLCLHPPESQVWFLAPLGFWVSIVSSWIAVSSSWHFRTAFLYAHMALSQGQDTREACLCNLYSTTIDQIGPDHFTHVILISHEGKTNRVSMFDYSYCSYATNWGLLLTLCLVLQNGNPEWTGAGRSKNVLLCPVGSLSMFFVERWDVLKQRVPNFSSQKSSSVKLWYIGIVWAIILTFAFAFTSN